MKMRRVITAAAAALGLTIAGLVAMPASAQASLAQCGGTGKICVWEHADFAGAYGGYAGQVSQFPPALNNKISSVWNRHANAWVFFDGPNFVYPMFCLKPSARARNLVDHHGPGTGNFNDRISSARRTGDANCPDDVWVIH